MFKPQWVSNLQCLSVRHWNKWIDGKWLGLTLNKGKNLSYCKKHFCCFILLCLAVSSRTGGQAAGPFLAVGVDLSAFSYYFPPQNPQPGGLYSRVSVLAEKKFKRKAQEPNFKLLIKLTLYTIRFFYKYHIASETTWIQELTRFSRG